MAVVAIIGALAAILWGVILARRGSLLAGCAVFLVVAYVFGADFWHLRVGPLPITLDRLVVAGLLAAFAVQWRMGQLPARPLVASDWWVAGLTLLLTASTLLAGSPEDALNPQSAWGRLITAFMLPALLYFVARRSSISRRGWIGLLACFALLGVYLGATALLEMSGKWSLVFPRYIANPNLGIHFGRARGPGLNSASLGMYLTACGCCAWLLLRFVFHRWQQLAIFVDMPLVAAGVFATYTRSAWLGFAAAAIVIAAFQTPRRLRLPAFGFAGVTGLLIASIAWSNVIGLRREGTAEEAEHSVNQRASFAYVSWQMFKDHPIAGVGFGQFYDRKLPYLSDRSQTVELESIRPLHHHNTLLGLLTETGLVGLAAFLALLATWAREAWRLATGRVGGSSYWQRTQGVLMLALLANYLCSALFHDLTLVPAQHWLLFLFAAVTVNLRQTAVKTTASDIQETAIKNHSVARGGRPGVSRPGWSSYAGDAPRGPMGNVKSVQLFGMKLSQLTMIEAIEQLMSWCDEPRGASCRYVVTPNVDHAVLFQSRGDLRAAYADASLVLADGAPIVLASRLVGRHQLQRALPERVAGSDLVPQLFASVKKPLRVFLLGAGPGVAEIASGRIESQWPKVEVVGTYSPPLGFEKIDAECAAILARVAAASPDLVVVGFGAPKQELWVHRHHHDLQAKVALCVGATIDFLAGEKSRSPVWMQRAGLEWAHRVITEPRRLAGRYARDAWIFPGLVWREMVKSS